MAYAPMILAKAGCQMLGETDSKSVSPLGGLFDGHWTALLTRTSMRPHFEATELTASLIDSPSDDVVTNNHRFATRFFDLFCGFLSTIEVFGDS